MICPCGSGRRFEDCCGPLLAGEATAPTAEALMRSRYAAHVVGAIDYLIETWEAGKGADRAEVERWARESAWRGLTIVATEAGGEGDAGGVVEFQARYAVGGVERVHHERSRFRRRDGRWVYVDGAAVTPKATTAAKVGRNEPCPCGSGKKHKKCCGA